MKECEFEQIKKVRERDIQDFLLEKLNPDIVNEFMNLIYDYYTHFEQQLQQQKQENEELKSENNYMKELFLIDFSGKSFKVRDAMDDLKKIEKEKDTYKDMLQQFISPAWNVIEDKIIFQGLEYNSMTFMKYFRDFVRETLNRQNIRGISPLKQALEAKDV